MIWARFAGGKLEVQVDAKKVRYSLIKHLREARDEEPGIVVLTAADFDPINLTFGETNSGAGSFPGDSGDMDRGTAGNGAPSAVTAGNPGRFVIC